MLLAAQHTPICHWLLTPSVMCSKVAVRLQGVHCIVSWQVQLAAACVGLCDLFEILLVSHTCCMQLQHAMLSTSQRSIAGPHTAAGAARP